MGAMNKSLSNPGGQPGSGYVEGSGQDLADLLARVARGDHAAFEAVYDQLAGPVYGLVRKVLRDPAQAESVKLAYYGGYTYPQVAELLGVALGTVKTRIRDGLIRLRDCMEMT
jgi:RNA polymerase sigma-70 factor (ECF subfamily)